MGSGAGILEEPKEQEKMNANGEIAALYSDFLQLLLLPDNLHFDILRVKNGDHEYLLPPSAKKLTEYITSNPHCLSYTGKIRFGDSIGVEFHDQDYLLEPLKIISKNLLSIAANVEIRLNKDTLYFCRKCGSFELFINVIQVVSNCMERHKALRSTLTLFPKCSRESERSNKLNKRQMN